MPVFPKPKFVFDYDVDAEIALLRAHRIHRNIPERTATSLLVATWNIANLGAQQRRDPDLRLISEVMSWFDLVAVQECRENFGDLDDIVRKVGAPYRMLLSDASGNNERLTYIYNSSKLELLEEIGEIAFPPSQYRYIKLKGIRNKFDGFDRTPYLASFAVGNTSFVFVNVHLYFGSAKSASVGRRSLETYAVARWANLRSKSVFSFTRELVALGDFNMPKRVPGDPIFDALTKLGMEVPEHSTLIASSIATDAQYDQIALLPHTAKATFMDKGVFDYDTVIFPELWADGKNRKNFLAYLRYYMSDHRPMWIQLSVA